MLDTSTPLGAEVAGWAYPASTKDLLLLASTIKDKHAFEQISPWDMQAQINEQSENMVSDEEFQQAIRDLDQEIIFTKET